MHPPPPPPPVASWTAHACVAALPEVLEGGMFVVMMRGDDPLARTIAANVARAAGDSPEGETPGMRTSLDARPAPRALVLEMRAILGDALTGRLEAPLAARHVRVLWLTREEHTVIDIPIETSHVRRGRGCGGSEGPGVTGGL
ncbi:MAG: hypothetical protein ACLQVI_42180 [Polyangiaceae bacterium]|jgi:hypothetical protein